MDLPFLIELSFLLVVNILILLQLFFAFDLNCISTFDRMFIGFEGFVFSFSHSWSSIVAGLTFAIFSYRFRGDAFTFSVFLLRLILFLIIGIGMVIQQDEVIINLHLINSFILFKFINIIIISAFKKIVSARISSY